MNRTAVQSARGLYLDFLAPHWTRSQLRTLHNGALRQTRCISSSANRHAQEERTSSSNTAPNKPAPPLTAEQKRFLDGALRVNQAGELAATLIYANQIPPLLRQQPTLRPLMEHMYEQESGHLKTFNALLAKHRVRPTALTPVWTVLASGLGWATGALGREASMACTEAVETEIGEHYNGQVRELLAWAAERRQRGEALGADLEQLMQDIRRIRDEELEHLDTAVENDAKEANAYPVLTAVIRGGCRGAIWLSERV